MSAQPCSNTAALDQYEIEQDKLHAKGMLMEQIAKEHMNVFNEDYAAFTDNLSPLERDNLLSEFLYILSSDSTSEMLRDELHAKKCAVALRLARREMDE